jgi:hypothetical protein
MMLLLFQTRARFVVGTVERRATSTVKASMDHLRTVVCSVLPVLWLLAAAYCPADPEPGGAKHCRRNSLSPKAERDHAPLTEARLWDQSARCVSRRAGTHAGWGGPEMLALISAPALGDLEPPSSPSAVSTHAFGLAQCWQFQWRTASEPRAPSSVS